MDITMLVVKILISVAPAIGYAISELKVALEKGESIRYFEIGKTVVIALFSAGMISTQTSDNLMGILSNAGFSSTFTYFADKIINNYLKIKGKKPL